MTSEPRGPRTRKRLLEASAQVFAVLVVKIVAELASDEIGRLGGGLVTRFTRALNERLHARSPTGLMIEIRTKPRHP